MKSRQIDTQSKQSSRSHKIDSESISSSNGPSSSSSELTQAPSLLLDGDVSGTMQPPTKWGPDSFQDGGIKCGHNNSVSPVVLVKLHYVHVGQGQGNPSNLSAKSYSPSPYGFSLGPDTLDSCSRSLHTARCHWCLCGKGGKTSDIFTMYYLYSYYNLKTNKRKDERTPSH